jgi:hypothetical protein
VTNKVISNYYHDPRASSIFQSDDELKSLWPATPQQPLVSGMATNYRTEDKLANAALVSTQQVPNVLSVALHEDGDNLDLLRLSVRFLPNP